MNKKHIGSNLDDFLREEQLLETAEGTAVKRVIAFQIEREMKLRRLTKTQMATRMKTRCAGTAARPKKRLSHTFHPGRRHWGKK